VSTATLCAGALRSSFELCLEKLEEEGIDTGELGLAIGFEFGPVTVTRLGMHGDRVRCSIGRGVLASEEEQTRCAGSETAIGSFAYEAGTQAVRDLLGSKRKVSDLDYNEAVEAMSEKGDETAKAVKKAAFATVAPAIAAASDRTVRPSGRASEHGGLTCPIDLIAACLADFGAAELERETRSIRMSLPVPLTDGRQPVFNLDVNVRGAAATVTTATVRSVQ